MMEVFICLWGFLVGASTVMMVNSHKKTTLIQQLKKFQVVKRSGNENRWYEGYCDGVQYVVGQIERWL